MLSALSADIVPVIARALAVSADEANIKTKDEEAAATQGQPHTKNQLDKGSLQVIKEDAVAPSVCCCIVVMVTL